MDIWVNEQHLIDAARPRADAGLVRTDHGLHRATRARILAHVDPEARGRIEALGHRADRTENLLVILGRIGLDTDEAGSFHRPLRDAHGDPARWVVSLSISWRTAHRCIVELEALGLIASGVCFRNPSGPRPSQVLAPHDAAEAAAGEGAATRCRRSAPPSQRSLPGAPGGHPGSPRRRHQHHQNRRRSRGRREHRAPLGRHRHPPPALEARLMTAAAPLGVFRESAAARGRARPLARRRCPGAAAVVLAVLVGACSNSGQPPAAQGTGAFETTTSRPGLLPPLPTEPDTEPDTDNGTEPDTDNGTGD